MTPTVDQAIEIVRQLPPPDREKVRDWIEEENQNNADLARKREVLDRANEKFRRALQWVEENTEEFDGQFVVLDGDELIAHGIDSKAVYEEARAKGFKSPFLKRIKAKILPFGGW